MSPRGQEQFRAQGYNERVSLVGHGVGPWWRQQEPYIVSSSPWALEEGMVLAMEPRVGFWHLPDMIQIIRDGPRLISTRFNTDKMLVVG